MGLSGLLLTGAALLFGASAAPIVDQGSAMEPISGRYIIQVKAGSNGTNLDSHLSWVDAIHTHGIGKRNGSAGGIAHTFSIGDHFAGYSGTFDDATIELIKKNHEVVHVEPAQIWSASFIEGSQQTPNAAVIAINSLLRQENAPWGLGAISHQSGRSDEYVYDENAGAGGFAYVIDSGVRVSHNEFEGRIQEGYSVIDLPWDEDGVGHGTHVSGIIAGRTFGVAKQATIVPIRALNSDGKGGTDLILKGVEWAVNDILSNGRSDVSVINMSLGGGYSRAFNDAVNAAIQKGVLIVVAAGNDNMDAEDFSPASAELAVTVGAIDIELQQSKFSNWGRVLDIYGPGTDIVSAWNDGDDSAKVISGTSMATPHVAGVCLSLMTVLNTGDAEGTISSLIELATPDILFGVRGGAPNLLAYNGSDE